MKSIWAGGHYRQKRQFWSNSLLYRIFGPELWAQSGGTLFSMNYANTLWLFLVAVPLTCVETRVPSGDGQSGTENAAVKYLRADVSLRQSYTLGPDAAATLQKALESPLDKEDERLVAAADQALVEFHHGAASKYCNWEMSQEDGPLANTAHRGALMELVYVAGLRARLRFRDGAADGAIDDGLAAIAAARHLSVDGSLASVLFAYRLEDAINRLFAKNLYLFSPAQLIELPGSLDALPTGSNLGEAFKAEKVRRNDVGDAVRGAKSRDDLIELLRDRLPVLQSNRAAAAEIVDGCGGTIRGFLTCLSQQRSFYELWASRFDMPPEQYEKEYNAEIKEVSKGNSVIRQFTPALPRFRWAEAYHRTRRVLLIAAIGVRMDGPNVLDKYPDPYDGKSFSYIAVDGGFRLESHLIEGGIPVSLFLAQASEDRKVGSN